MKRAHLTPLGAVMRGALAGAVGTLAMDLVWFARFKREGGEQRFVEWEVSATPDWNEGPPSAAAPPARAHTPRGAPAGFPVRSSGLRPTSCCGWRRSKSRSGSTT